jgi:hypothetical protein
MTYSAQWHIATVLANGKVLVTGGTDGGSLSRTELYDPSTETWTVSDSLNYARERHTVSVLTNEKLLVAGGIGSNRYMNSAEIY